MFRFKIRLKYPVILLLIFGLGIWLGANFRDSLEIQRTSLRSKYAINVREVVNHKTSKGTCVPKKNIFFLKTHKTAGTVVQNVLLRHADKNGIFVGLSTSDNDPRFKYAQGHSFHHSLVRKTVNPINMLCHHMRFNKKEVRKILPPDTLYVTIIRDTTPCFESYFDYLHWDCAAFAQLPNLPSTLETWISQPEKFFKGNTEGSFWWFAKNGIFYDLGFDNLSDNDTYIDSAIDEVEETFDLVMISDYLEMSLILLKDLLCLSLEDIAHISLNSRYSKAHSVTPSTDKKIRQWNKADSKMYQHFNKTFWNKVHEYGTDRMSDELEELRKINSDLMENCIDGGGSVPNSEVKNKQYKVFQPKGVEMSAYNLKPGAIGNDTCSNVIKPEVKWFKYLLSKQYNHKVS